MSSTPRGNSLLAALLLAFFCLPLASIPAQTQTSDLSSRRRRWLHDPYVNEEYKKWLREDVAWIISDREMFQFVSLLTDAQRDSFVAAFWERRNPTPGSSENKSKQEHYRRLAYANQHFAFDVAGWKTDRGRIYIMYGPPDELERHPSGPGSGAQQTPDYHYPYEVWHYKNIKDIGRDVSIEFVDTCECGDYRMTVDRSEKLSYPRP